MSKRLVGLYPSKQLSKFPNSQEITVIPAEIDAIAMANMEAL
jgi:hypothetical protein